KPSAGFVRTVFTGETEDRDSLLFLGSVFVLSSADEASVVNDFTVAAAATGQLMTFDFAHPGSGAIVRGRVVSLLDLGAGQVVYCNRPNATVSVVDGAGTRYRVF